MTITAPERPVLDPTPVGSRIDAVLAEVQESRLDRLSAFERVNTILDVFADAIEAVGGVIEGDPDMWEWSQRVRFAAIPDGCEPMSMSTYLGEFSDALTHLWEDPRMDVEDGSGE